MKSDNTRSGDETLWDFATEFLTVCPKCGSRSRVYARGAAGAPRHVCENCPTTEDLIEPTTSYLYSGGSADTPRGTVVLGAPVDAYFHYTLWLVTPCAGHTLWAYNLQHLSFLRAYVSSQLRDRPLVAPGMYRNKLLESRLPKWMISAKNRSQVLGAIEKLERKAWET